MKIIKGFLIVLLSSFIGIIANPELPFASDSVVLTGINDTMATATIILPEPVEPVVESTPESNSYDGPSYENSYQEPISEEPFYEEAQYVEPIYESRAVNYTVTYYVGSSNEFNSIAHSLSGYDLYKFKKMIYGHNSWNLLGNLVERYIGENITITEGGVMHNYRVADIAVYEKTADGNLEWDSKLMGRIAKTAMGHNVALLTCYGTNYGNGDASHRLVVYADEI